jgi:hypothetical protein
MELSIIANAREYILAKGGAVHILSLRGANLC